MKNVYTIYDFIKYKKKCQKYKKYINTNKNLHILNNEKNILNLLNNKKDNILNLLNNKKDNILNYQEKDNILNYQEKDNILNLKDENILNLKDENEQNEQEIHAFPDGIYQYVLYTCIIHPISILSAFYFGNIKAGILSIILSSTSLDYWQKPLVYSYRRYIDMLAAFSVLSYHFYLSLFTIKRITCSGLFLVGMSFRSEFLGLDQK